MKPETDVLNIFKFEKKKVGEMSLKEFADYYNSWVVFIGRVAEYSQALDAMCKMMDLKRER